MDDNFEEDIGESGSYFDIWEGCDDIIFQYMKKTKPIVEYLNTKDYTLNAPLVPDEIDNFILYLSNKTHVKIFERPTWPNRKKWLIQEKIPLLSLKAAPQYHSWVATQFLKRNTITKEIDKLLSCTDKDAAETFPLVYEFFKTWTNQTYKYKSRKNPRNETKVYGEIMLETLNITWILNATSTYELENLQETLKLKTKKYKDNTKISIYDSGFFGEVQIGYDFVWFKRDNILLDRNMLLMLKDTATARFHTLMAIEFRETTDYATDHYDSVLSMYKAGDRLLEKFGCPSYKAIKMVEPICSLRMSQLARMHRPLIPEFKHFKEHIEKTTTDLVKDFPLFKDLHDIIMKQNNVSVLLTMYGGFRHWGHPYINYLDGLEALYQNVTMIKTIDRRYAEQLASDLAYKILCIKFRQKRKWFVDLDQVPSTDPMCEHIFLNTWPTRNQIVDYGDRWHKLPLTTCFEIPDVVDPSLIYSDKSHSMNYKEVRAWIQKSASRPIQSLRVLSTLLSTQATDWPTFLQRINDEGLSDDELIIGLKGKERELKDKGRFFALMSWALREYFVYTEYLIKTFIVPLFKGLTMADDQTTVIKKMLESSSGQGGVDYKNIGIANHIDYEKWNNHQRGEATTPVFTVMGQFFGYPKLFARTHEFFEKSFIYYKDRPDLMKVVDGRIVNATDKRVCWQGQAGGLEGLRQKGWSVVNLLVLERESRIRTTAIKILAQGDNQVICTQYTLDDHTSEATIIDGITKLIKNNEAIMRAIQVGTSKLGLMINNDETLQSADLVIYGKTIIYRGNIRCLEEKRFSRITCTTNDQLPGMANTLSTVSTNCLTVAHFSKSPVNSIMHYNWLGNFVRLVIQKHNPALRNTMWNALKDPKMLDTFEYKIAFLYLDPALQGVAGMSLSRFFIRQFPDPITESLSFWKRIAETTENGNLKRLAIKFGNPVLKTFKREHFSKLLENPTSLNLPHGLSSTNFLKNEIRKGLLADPTTIAHSTLRQVLSYAKREGDALNNFLETCKPCFPRFASEFKSATYTGLAESLIGLFENSRTIRTSLSYFYSREVDKAILRSEEQSLEGLLSYQSTKVQVLWKCSSSHADFLREKSWGRKLVGTTVPHPFEMLKVKGPDVYDCKGCSSSQVDRNHIIVRVPSGIEEPETRRGPYPPYLGSKTSENTNLTCSWEKESIIPFIKRAARLRSAISWFVAEDSHLGNSILANLKALTGEDPGDNNPGFKRTGSALHRFYCTRQSTGGYTAQSPIYSTRMMITTDSMQELGKVNHDFMFQALMLYAQITTGEIHKESPWPGTYHFHINCISCLRTIEEPMIESDYPFKFQDVSNLMESWKPPGTAWFKRRDLVQLPPKNWEDLSNGEKSYHIGRIQGFFFVDEDGFEGDQTSLDGLFPLSLKGSLSPYEYLEGLVDGMFRGTCSRLIHKRFVNKAEPHWMMISGNMAIFIQKLSSCTSFQNIIHDPILKRVVTGIPHQLSPNYPEKHEEVGLICKNYLMALYKKLYTKKSDYLPRSRDLWLFSDFATPSFMGIFVTADEITQVMSKRIFRKSDIDYLKQLNQIVRNLRSEDFNISTVPVEWLNRASVVQRQVRHVLKDKLIDHTSIVTEKVYQFGKHESGYVVEFAVPFITEKTDQILMNYPRIKNPLMSSVRLMRVATSAPLKIKSILDKFKISYRDCIAAGDGSGGIGSYLLRRDPLSRLIFNSLLGAEGLNLRGTNPQPPSAIYQVHRAIRSRCVNLMTSSEEPSDLSRPETWRCFIRHISKFFLKIDLVVMDMEYVEGKGELIVKNCANFIPQILSNNGVLIFKTYGGVLSNKKENILTECGKMFKNASLVQTEFSSSNTSEIYVVFRHLRHNDTRVLWPDWLQVHGFLRQTFVFKSFEDEFKRALNVYKKDTLKGVPKELISDPVSDLQTIYIHCGMSPSTAVLWAERASTPLGLNTDNYILTIIGILSIHTVQTTRISPINDLIPSDQRLKKMMGGIMGMSLFQSLRWKDIHIAQKVQKAITNGLSVELTIRKTTTSSDIHHRIAWSLSKEGSFRKSLCMNEYESLVSFIVRALMKLFKNCPPIRPNSRIIDAHLRSVNYKLSMEHLREHTGGYDLLSTGSLRSPGDFEGGYTNQEIVEDVFIN
nr:MAG: RNA-dependent RNA polymerase [Lantra virus]